ncbi:MAG: prenyltransferase [Actinomycetota bacterium]|nr:prenyltransferase [Actinomycetota bacterium]
MGTPDGRGGYYTITNEWSWDVVLASLPYALGTTAIIFGKHIDKLEADREKGIRTLPVLLGEKASRYAVLGMMALQYLLVLYLVLAGFFTPIMLVVFLSLYPFFKLILPVYRAPNPSACPRSTGPTSGRCGSWRSPFCTTAASVSSLWPVS